MDIARSPLPNVATAKYYQFRLITMSKNLIDPMCECLDKLPSKTIYPSISASLPSPTISKNPSIRGVFSLNNYFFSNVYLPFCLIVNLIIPLITRVVQTLIFLPLSNVRYTLICVPFFRVVVVVITVLFLGVAVVLVNVSWVIT